MLLNLIEIKAYLSKDVLQWLFKNFVYCLHI